MLRYKVDGSAEMTDDALVRVPASVVDGERDLAARPASGAKDAPSTPYLAIASRMKPLRFIFSVAFFDTGTSAPCSTSNAGGRRPIAA